MADGVHKFIDRCTYRNLWLSSRTQSFEFYFFFLLNDLKCYSLCFLNWEQFFNDIEETRILKENLCDVLTISMLKPLL